MNLLMNIANNLMIAMVKISNAFRLSAPAGAGNQVIVEDGGSTPHSTDKLYQISQDVNRILKSWVGPIMMCIGAVGAIYIIVLAVQYAKSESDSKRAEAKTRMMNCLIGVIAIIVLATLCLTLDWGLVVGIFGYTSK